MIVYLLMEVRYEESYVLAAFQSEGRAKAMASIGNDPVLRRDAKRRGIRYLPPDGFGCPEYEVESVEVL